jgi:hypothetical protein
VFFVPLTWAHYALCDNHLFAKEGSLRLMDSMRHIEYIYIYMHKYTYTSYG